MVRDGRIRYITSKSSVPRNEYVRYSAAARASDVRMERYVRFHGHMVFVDIW